MTERRSLDAVDAALEEARREAHAAALPAALRDRILAAAHAPAHAPRGRMIDFVLRAAAVAAAAAAVLLVAPVQLEAAEFDATPLVEWNARIADTVARSIPAIQAPPVFDPAIGSADGWAFAAAGVLLAGAGLWLVRRERRR
jgi:hypothetical protein